MSNVTRWTHWIVMDTNIHLFFNFNFFGFVNGNLYNSNLMHELSFTEWNRKNTKRKSYNILRMHIIFFQHSLSIRFIQIVLSDDEIFHYFAPIYPVYAHTAAKNTRKKRKIKLWLNVLHIFTKICVLFHFCYCNCCFIVYYFSHFSGLTVDDHQNIWFKI